MSSENMNDLIVLGFITLWIVLCAGEPDMIDAINKRISDSSTQEVIEK